MNCRAYWFFLLTFLCLPARGADAGYAVRAIDLVEQPAAQSRVVTRLAKKQSVEIIGREGNWVRARAGSATGWVRLGALRLDAAPSKVAAPAARRAPAAARDSGIRGFSEEELLVGAPNQVEGERLRRLGVSARDAASFARAANLKPRQQDYIQMQEFMPEGGFPKDFFDE